MTTWAKQLFKDSPLSIAQGEVLGHTPRNIFGYQTDVSTAFIPAWEFATAYTYPVSALPMTVSSGNAADNGSLLKIIGLDADYNEIEETVTIPATTTKGFFRINDVIFLGVGGNLGLITVANGGTNYAGIRIKDGRNQASIYTVPAGKCFFLYRIDAFSSDSTAAKSGIFKNETQSSTGQLFNVARTTFYNNMKITRSIPFKYEEKTDIQLQLATFSGNHEMNVFGEGVIVDKIVLNT